MTSLSLLLSVTLSHSSVLIQCAIALVCSSRARTTRLVLAAVNSYCGFMSVFQPSSFLFSKSKSARRVRWVGGYLTTGHDNDDEQEDDADNDAHSHLHVLPPHLLAYSIRSAAEAVGLGREMVGLVLQIVQPLATF